MDKSQEFKKPALTAEQYLKLREMELKTEVQLKQEETKQEQAKAQVLLKQEETKQLAIALRKQELENERQKRTKTTVKELAKKDGNQFYEEYVSNNLVKLNIDDLLKSHNDIDDDLVKIFENKFNKLEQCDKITEQSVQCTMNNVIVGLSNLEIFKTPLQYVDTSKGSGYLEGQRPDCSFIYKNLNIRDEFECLRDFIICIGELKRPGVRIDAQAGIGQLCKYLTLLLNVQNRKRIYGFLFNLKHITFYCAEMNGESCYKFYCSEPLDILHDLNENETKQNRSALSRTTSGLDATTLTQTVINKEAIKKLIKFLTMEPAFYAYDMLNINPHDFLYKNELYIKYRLGKGVSSIVYGLCDNRHKIGRHALKISTSGRFDGIFKNEIQICRKLKQLTNSDYKFNLFFTNILKVPEDDAQSKTSFDLKGNLFFLKSFLMSPLKMCEKRKRRILFGFRKNSENDNEKLFSIGFI